MVEVENMVICNGEELAAINFASNITDENVTYAWTNDNVAIGLAAAGEGNIAAFTATNLTGTDIVANITVTPTYTYEGVSCVGEAISFTITVNPSPVMNAVADQVVCNGTETAAIEFSSNITDGRVVYNWTNDNTTIGLAAEGTGNIAAFTAVNAGLAAVVANITVTPTYTYEGVSCVGQPTTFTIMVNPTPVMNAVEDQVACNGSEVEAIEFTSTVTDGVMTYAWTNDNPAIGLAAAGEGNIAAFVAVNTGLETIVANIEVTPTYTNNGVSCQGEAVTFTITVNPAPVMAAIADQVVCNGTATEAIVFSSEVHGGTITYAWTNDNANIGLAAEGTGNIASFTAVNTGLATAVANITVTPTYTGNGITCVGTPVSFTITVNPEAIMNVPADQVVCDGTSTNAVAFTTELTDGTMTYAWTNDNPAIGLAAEGTGDIAAFTAVNTTNDVAVAHIAVTPTYTNNGIACVGEAVNFTISVYPTAIMNPVADQTIYSRESTEAIVFSSNVSSKVTYAWVNDNPAIGLAASGEGNIPSFVGAAPITTTQVGHITVTPTYSSDNVSCDGQGITFTITVNPTYLVVVNAPQNGTLTTNASVAANGDLYAYPDQVITMTTVPATNYVLENVTVTELGNNFVVVPVVNDQTFVMPEFDVEVTATFMDANDLLIKPAILDLGYRPINAWMYSKFFTVANNTQNAATITHVDLTNTEFFNMDALTLPFELAAGENMQVGLNTNYMTVDPGLYTSTMVLMGQNRKSYMRQVIGTAYTPVTPDVWELAYNVTSYPYTTTQVTEGVIYDNYQLPGTGADGYDGVYKLVFDHDVILNAAITEGADPKVVLYEPDFNGVGGPHLDNYYGGSSLTDVEATIAAATSQLSNMPYNTYYNYSIAQMLYTAEDLTAAGLQAGVINGIEFYSESTNCLTRDNISIWMGNVTATSLANSTSATSYSIAGMPCVFTGSMTQVVGWNAFEFNGAPFVWDGNSNVLITIAMNAGVWTSQTYWKMHNPGFYACLYKANDNNPYNPETMTYPALTATNTARPDIKFHASVASAGSIVMGDGPIVDLGLFAGTYYLVASSTSTDSYTLQINAEDMPLPEEPTAIYPLHMATGIETPVTLEWELGQYTHEYQLIMGLNYPPTEIVVDWTDNLASSFNAGELLHNKVYFWRINERNSSGTTTGPLWAFTTELNEPATLTIVDDELYEGEDAVLNWVSPSDRTLRGYNIYQDGVKINTATVTETTYAVTGLTYNMEGYSFAVTAVYDEGESDYSNAVTAYVTGNGTISGHVYEQDGVTGIAGATVAIIGYDEFNEIQQYVFTTNASGAYTGQVYAGMYLGGATKEGYQTVIDYVGTTVAYAMTTANYDFILNEEYYPVGKVIAEEMNDNDVHVTWMWTVPFDDIFVDFSDSQVPEGWTLTGSWQIVNACPSSLWGGAMPTAPFILADSDTPGTGVHITGYFTSPVIDATTLTTLTLEFDHYAKASMGDICEVQASADGTTWTTLIAYTGANTGSWTAPAHAQIDLSSFVGGEVQIRFFYDDSNGWKYGWAIDNISISSPDKGGDRSFASYNVYRRNITNPTQVQMLTANITETEYHDMTWGTTAAGPYQWGVSANYQGNRGESEIVWSNQIDKSMIANVTLNVTTNSNDPVTGAQVTLTNVSEPELELVYEVTLDETGTYNWPEFRKGEYNVNIELNGFETLATTASVWNDNTTLNYVLQEVITEIEGLYVSTTGWAIFGEMNAGPTGGGELTVYDGTSTSSYVPFYGLWVDDYTKCEMIMPAADLADMNGYDIHSMKFYLSSPATTGWGAAHFQVYMKEVNQTTLAGSYIGTDGATMVWEGSIDPTQPEIEITFTTAYRYTGGNLLVCLYEDVKGTYKSAYFYGVEAANAAASGYSSSSLSAVTFNSRNFLPKTTFVYGNAKGDDRLVQYYNIKLNGVAEGTSTLPFYQHNVDNLAEGDTCVTSVQAVYGTGTTDWVDFTWVYTPCDNFVGLNGEPTAEWAGDDIVLNWTLPEGGTPGPGPGPSGSNSFTEGFENGLNNWTVLVVNSDGGEWLHSSNNPSGYDYNELAHTGTGFAMCYSFVDYVGAYNTDAYLITPQKYDIVNGSTLTFWADNANDSYPENFSVCVATADNPTANDFTQVWSGGAKGGNGGNATVRHQDNRYENWRSHSIDLSAYAGQTVYIAFHDVNYDAYEIWIDDVALTAGTKGNRDYLVDQAQYVTDPGAINGADASNLQGAQSTYGPGAQHSSGNMVGDDFTLAAASTITSIEVYAYQTGSTTTSTFNALYATIYDGNPMSGGQIIWGDMNTNIMTTTAWTNCYRTSNLSGTTRPIMSITAENLNIPLEAGTYYLVWNLGGTGSSGPWGQPVAIAGQTNTGNAIQYITSSSAWQNLTDSGCGDPYGMAFRLGGNAGSTPTPTPTPGAGVIGVEIFRDGEWIAEVHAPTQTYTDIAPETPGEYEFRVVWDGDVTNWTYYAMSCAQVAEVGEATCDAPENLTGSWNNDDENVVINWTYGEAPVSAINNDFESGMNGWTTIDADGDGSVWMLASAGMGTGYGHNGSSDMVLSKSYDNSIGALTPDNYLVSPQTPLGGTFTFYACAQDASWASEHFGVAVSTTNNTSASAFTTIQEWTMTAKENGGPRGTNAQGNWYQYTVDLSSYAGQTGYIAIRHFNCTDFFYLDVDDIVLNLGKGFGDPVNFEVYRDGASIATVPYTGAYSYTYVDTPAAGLYRYQVKAIYEACESDFALTPNGSANYVDVPSYDAVSENDNEIMVYPNPTKDNVKIEANGMKHITVVSALGQILFDADIEGDVYEMNLGQYKAGVYSIRIYTENTVSVKRVTVVR